MSDLRDQIEQLEDKIEALAERAERCRKIIVFAKAVMVVGAVVMLAVVVLPIRFDPAALFGGMAAVLGGIVLRGSNRTTLEQTVQAMRAAEAERAALIGQIALRVVEG